MLKPVITSHKIIGKISAAAGLKQFKINNKRHNIDEHNLFWVTVPITQQETPIIISAEDAQGQKVNIIFSLFSKRRINKIPQLKNADIGYWLPVDAKPDLTQGWISNSAISNILGTIKAKHVMVVADSCYSGTLSTTSIPRSTADFSPSVHKEWVDIMNTTQARMALTSGGVQPVIDSGGNHSIFSKAFLSTLSSNKGLLEGYSLYTNVLSKVRKSSHKLNIDQVPDYAPIKHAGHEAGEFFFQRVKS